MEYKTILVHVDEARRAHEQIRIAATLAQKYDAHLIGAAVTGVTPQFFMPGAIGESNLALLGPALSELREHAASLLTEFEATVWKMDVKSFEKRLIDDDAGAGLSLQARYSDLVVIGQINPADFSIVMRADFPEYVLMNAGRPLLIIPYAGKFTHVGKRVLVAWDASMEATRAVTASIPLLQQADLVQVLVFDTGEPLSAHGQQPGADIALYLARHGVKVEVSKQKMAGDIDVGNALLSRATDFGADLIVMGGYGHTRFREVILGGVTRTVLASMTVPVFMSH
ncbi:Nucleotide-binding universal stress protein, UspA family [Collimonas sp. OK242]|jgi:nucleotide-binding universal stress UspA family protein|uniref:universal stress protein n=1 Tax=Collimonas sp. OK242 TaxID=1798195 RepID=UPI00089D9D7A|nr:universal stress protein [Collimonas sp. OK242]SDY56585.1 Nucleotide-binding universal stress protein, UspA family [Collimonas sp. OK242]